MLSGGDVMTFMQRADVLPDLSSEDISPTLEEAESETVGSGATRRKRSASPDGAAEISTTVCRKFIFYNHVILISGNISMTSNIFNK